MNICMTISGPMKFPHAPSQAQLAVSLNNLQLSHSITISLLLWIYIPTSRSLIKQKGALLNIFERQINRALLYCCPILLSPSDKVTLKASRLEGRQGRRVPQGDLSMCRLYSILSVRTQSCFTQYTAGRCIGHLRSFVSWTALLWASLYMFKSFSMGNQPSSYKNW